MTLKEEITSWLVEHLTEDGLTYHDIKAAYPHTSPKNIQRIVRGLEEEGFLLREPITWPVKRNTATWRRPITIIRRKA